jgi:hypothetical protein
MSRFRRPSCLTLLAFFCVALPAVPAFSEAKEAPKAVDGITAMNDLTSLEGFIKKKKSTDDDINGFLNSVSDAFNNIVAPEKPADDASEEEKKIYATAVKRHESLQAEFNKKAEKAILKCFDLVKLSRDKETNLRADVNRQAAVVISNLSPRMTEDQRDSFSTKLMKSLDGLAKAKYTVNADALEAGFAALGKMRMEKSLEWMAENFIHTKNQSKEIDRLIAAHKAMVMFPHAETPGKLRYEIVKEMIKTYSGTETQAEQTTNDKNVQAAKAFWDRVRVDAIKVMQHFAGETAQTAEGQVFNRVNDFEAWFREHKSVKKAPWKDEKKDK